MTTITVEIDKDKDLDAVKDFVANLGLKFSVTDTDELVYTDELKTMLDERYADYKAGKVTLVSAEESRQQIHDLLSGKVK